MLTWIKNNSYIFYGTTMIAQVLLGYFILGTNYMFMSITTISLFMLIKLILELGDKYGKEKRS